MQMIDKSSAQDVVGAAVIANGGAKDGVRGGGVFAVKCFDADGNLKWEAAQHNLVVNEGLKDMNDKYFLGSGYTATWYIGLYVPTASNDPAGGDTASSHAGWTEITPYSNATRPQCAFAAATTADPSVISNSSSPASFASNASATVGGAFLISNNTKGGTTGVLFSAANFAAPGDRAVVSGDTLVVTYTFSLDAA